MSAKQKTILVTGATDGIRLETARMLVSSGHNVFLHGRSPAKPENVGRALLVMSGSGQVESYVADLSRMNNVEALAKAVAEKHTKLDVLINNAGVFSTADPITQDGLDVRFAVNTIASYLLTKRLLPMFESSGRVIKLSSAAQASVDPEALLGRVKLPDGMAYAQSKLAITMWSRSMALALKDDGPAIIAVNPRSMLGSKMVKQAYGVAGGDLRIGTEILVRASLSDEFAAASGQYFDNDIGQFASPHPDARSAKKCDAIVRVMDLVNSCAVANRHNRLSPRRSLTSYAIGTRQLMQWLDHNPLVEFRSIDQVFNPMHISRNPKVVAVLPAREIDLSGRITLHTGTGNVGSGPSEVVDFFTPSKPCFTRTFRNTSTLTIAIRFRWSGCLMIRTATGLSLKRALTALMSRRLMPKFRLWSMKRIRI